MRRWARLDPGESRDVSWTGGALIADKVRDFMRRDQAPIVSRFKAARASRKAFPVAGFNGEGFDWRRPSGPLLVRSHSIETPKIFATDKSWSARGGHEGGKDGADRVALERVVRNDARE